MSKRSGREFRRQGHARGRGRVGENAAENWLEGQGFEIVERNITTRAGEIDLVAREEDTLCFVEIKARSNRTFGPAVAAVPPSKQRRIARAAALYLARNPTEAPCRFDVLAMDLEDGAWRFQLVRDAFQVPYGSFAR
jgi:putative endonuclease